MNDVDPIGRLPPSPATSKVVRKKRSSRDSNKDQREKKPDRHDDDHKGHRVDELV